MTTEIKEIYSKFLRLYEKLAEEREVITQQGVVLGKIITALDAETKLATEFKVQVRNGLKEGVREAAQNTGDDVKKALQENVTANVSSAVNELKNAADQTTKRLKEYDLLSTRWILIVLGCLIMASIGIGFMCAKWLAPAPWTDDQLATYNRGISLEIILDRVNKKERDRLIALAEKQIPPEENSPKWIREKYPDIKFDNEKLLKKYDELNK